jgi:hypothetical protein
MYDGGFLLWENRRNHFALTEKLNDIYVGSGSRQFCFVWPSQVATLRKVIKTMKTIKRQYYNNIVDINIKYCVLSGSAYYK